MRLCRDPKDINEAIKREHHVNPILEEILPKLILATVFSIVDVKCFVLEKESSYPTTFNSLFGTYRFNRIPFGLKIHKTAFRPKLTKHLRDAKEWYEL